LCNNTSSFHRQVLRFPPLPATVFPESYAQA